MPQLLISNFPFLICFIVVNVFIFGLIISEIYWNLNRKTFNLFGALVKTNK